MRTAAHIIVTPILFYIGWAFIGGLFVGVSGQPQDGPGSIIVGVGTLLVVPLGVWYGWRNRHR